MRTSSAPLATLIQFKDNGYKAEADVVSSNYYSSSVACMHRCELDRQANGYGREKFLLSPMMRHIKTFQARLKP